MFATLFLAVSSAFAVVPADPTDRHDVTVDVREISRLDHVGGDVTLILDALDPADASRLVPASDASTQLLWSTNGRGRKITVESDLASPRFALSVEARNLSGGGSAGRAVVLDAGLGAQDLVSDISQESAGCDLQYVASADVTDGIGAETHTVTYTLTAM